YAIRYLVTHGKEHFLYCAIGRRKNGVLHLHGLHHQQGITALDGIARLHGNRDDLAWHGGGQATTSAAGIILSMFDCIVQFQDMDGTITEYMQAFLVYNDSCKSISA